jgi:ERCC4-related helicase
LQQFLAYTQDIHCSGCVANTLHLTPICAAGLDVKACDLVIRFGGEPTLIQLIQSKGRARDANGRLVVICTPEEEAHLNEVVEQEQFVDAAFSAYEAAQIRA